MGFTKLCVITDVQELEHSLVYLPVWTIEEWIMGWWKVMMTHDPKNKKLDVSMNWLAKDLVKNTSVERHQLLALQRNNRDWDVRNYDWEKIVCLGQVNIKNKLQGQAWTSKTDWTPVRPTTPWLETKLQTQGNISIYIIIKRSSILAQISAPRKLTHVWPDGPIISIMFRRESVPLYKWLLLVVFRASWLVNTIRTTADQR